MWKIKHFFILCVVRNYYWNDWASPWNIITSSLNTQGRVCIGMQTPCSQSWADPFPQAHREQARL